MHLMEMHLKQLGRGVILTLVTALFPLCAPAQAVPAEVRHVPASAFLISGITYSGLEGYGPHEGLGGRNLPIAVGVDIGVHSFHQYRLAAEIRGVYPAYSGHVDGQQSIVGGLRLKRALGGKFYRLHFYSDVLAGRGKINYVDGGYPTGPLLYSSSSSAVYGGGGGFEADYSYHWAVVGDAQIEHWSVPVTTEGTIYSKSGMCGIVYRF